MYGSFDGIPAHDSCQGILSFCGFKFMGLPCHTGWTGLKPVVYPLNPQFSWKTESRIPPGITQRLICCLPNSSSETSAGSVQLKLRWPFWCRSFHAHTSGTCVVRAPWWPHATTPRVASKRRRASTPLKVWSV